MKLGSPAAMSKNPPSGPADARSVGVTVEQLESENARLRATLKEIAEWDSHDASLNYHKKGPQIIRDEYRRMAKDALAKNSESK